MLYECTVLCCIGAFGHRGIKASRLIEDFVLRKLDSKSKTCNECSRSKPSVTPTEHSAVEDK